MVAYHETKWRELKVYDDVYEVLRWLSGTDLCRGIISLGLTVKQAEKVIRLKIYEFLTPKIEALPALSLAWILVDSSRKSWTHRS